MFYSHHMCSEHLPAFAFDCVIPQLLLRSKGGRRGVEASLLRYRRASLSFCYRFGREGKALREVEDGTQWRTQFMRDSGEKG